MSNKDKQNFQPDSSLAQIASHLKLMFDGLCVPCTNIDMSNLREKLMESSEWLTHVGARAPDYDIELAVELYACAAMLIDRFPRCNDEQRLLVAGAVKYLLFRNDAVPDKHILGGLEDDRVIMNYALSRLGVNDALIPTKEERMKINLTKEHGGMEFPKRAVPDEIRKAWKALRALKN